MTVKGKTKKMIIILFRMIDKIKIVIRRTKCCKLLKTYICVPIDKEKAQTR